LESCGENKWRACYLVIGQTKIAGAQVPLDV